MNSNPKFKIQVTLTLDEIKRALCIKEKPHPFKFTNAELIQAINANKESLAEDLAWTWKNYNARDNTVAEARVLGLFGEKWFDAHIKR